MKESHEHFSLDIKSRDTVYVEKGWWKEEVVIRF